METSASSPGYAGDNRRGFLRTSLAVGAIGAIQQSPALGAQEPAVQPRRPVIEEHDPKNIKLAHRVPSTASEEELLFLQQIGLHWARVELQASDFKLPELGNLQAKDGESLKGILQIGERAPDFTIPTPTGGEITLAGLLRGKKALVIWQWFYG